MSRKVAEQMEAELRSQAHATRYLGHKQSITFEIALRNFIESKIFTPNHRNLLFYQRTISKILRMSKVLADLKSEELEEFRKRRVSLGMKPQTIQHELNLIRSSIKYVKKQGYQVPELSFPSLKISKGRLRYLSTDEEQRLLQQLDPDREGPGLQPLAKRNVKMTQSLQDCYDLVVLLLDTGARYGEIADLRWNQIDLENRLVRLWRPKVQNESVLFMTDRVHDVFQQRKLASASEHVFTNRQGGPRGYAAQSIKKSFNRAGLTDCTIHTLRHTHATRLIQNGLSLYEVRSVLGHSDIKTTLRYAHLEQTDVTSKARDVINRLNRL
jgi:integrase